MNRCLDLVLGLFSDLFWVFLLTLKKPKIIEMRKSVLFVVFLSVSALSQAQGWLDIGIKGSWGPTWLFNKNIFEDQEFNHQLSFGHSFGGKLGLNFNDFHELTLDVMFGTFKQDFKFNITDSVTGASPEFEKSMSYKTLDFFLLYRHNKDGRYLEVGPAFSLVQSASGSNSWDSSLDGEIADNLITSYPSFVFGFGSYFIGTENFGITLGARFNYGLSDLISDKGQVFHYPANTPYPTYTASHPLYAQLVVEANYDFAYLAKAKCSNKKKVIFF
jgi:hypothetical protein